MDRVAEGLHRQRMLPQAMNPIKIRDPSQSDYQVVVFNLVRMMRRTMHHLNPFVRKIDSTHLAVEEIDLLQHFADGVHYMRDIDVACRDLVQHGCEQEKVLAVYQRCFCVWKV